MGTGISKLTGAAFPHIPGGLSRREDNLLSRGKDSVFLRIAVVHRAHEPLCSILHEPWDEILT